MNVTLTFFGNRSSARLPYRSGWAKRVTMAVVFLAAAAQGLPQRAAAHDSPASHGLSNPAPSVGASTELGTSAAFDGAGRLWVVAKSARENDGLVLQYSDDVGKTWSQPSRVLAEPEAVAAKGQERPRIAVGRKGELFIVYTKPVAKPHVGDIRFVRSLDGGKTFSAPLTIHANRDAIAHAFGTMVVNAQGDIVIAWIDGRDSVRAKKTNTPYAGSALYYAVSRDGGASFQGDYQIADHSCECCRIGLTRDAQGEAAAMWRHVFAPNVRDHALAVLPATGRPSTLARVTFDDWRIDACPHHGPSVAYSDDGTRHQVWFNGRQDGGGVFYSAASPSGATSQPVALGSAQASHADLVVSGRRVAIAWKEFDGHRTALHNRISTDGGRTWREAVTAHTDGASDHPFLVAGPPGIVLVWHSRNEGIRVIPLGGKS